MARRIAIVTTTIHVPKLLTAYSANARKNKHKDLFFVVVADKKTPPATEVFCKQLARKSNYAVEYFSVLRQEVYLKNYPELGAHLKWNSIMRRNIGILFAYERGADCIVTIDDDNFVAAHDFVGAHAVVGTEVQRDVLRATTGWINVCSFLTEEEGIPFYHRGFPMQERWKKTRIARATKKVRVAVNAGFWLEDPDIDAITRLVFPINVVGFPRKKNFALGKGTWSPFNSQNTALARGVVPAYFLSPYVGRYDDIWASYVVLAIADHLGESITFGNPLVRQKRNPHNYLKDFDAERQGMMLSGMFCGWLRATRLRGKTYGACYREIRIALERKLEQSDLRDESREHVSKFIEGMRVWEKTIARVASH